MNNDKRIVSSSPKKQKTDSEVQILSFRERRCLLSRIPSIRTVGSRRSKKQSRSTRRGLRVNTDLVEF